jgi:hypothetical protein
VGFAITSVLWGLPGVRDSAVARLRTPMIPVGLAVAVLAYLGLAATLHGGRSGGLPLEADLLVLGLALGLAFSPIIGTALTHVPLALAADASGLLSTVFQLGQVLGVALLGTIYLSSIHTTGAAASAHALTVTVTVLAVSAVICAALALLLVRPRRPRLADSSLG